FEAVGAKAGGKMSDRDLKELEDVVCPGAGACGGQFTANTMAMALEFLGLSPMGTASIAATDPAKDEVGRQSGALVMDMLRRSLRPRQIATRAAFENAIAGVAASGGSTNAVLHLLALAREIGVPLTIDDFDRVSRRTPVWADLKPRGRFTAVDLGNAGGGAVVGKRLVAAGLVDGSALTPSGRTFAEEAARAVETPGQEVVSALERPLKPTGGLVILRGNLAPEGCVVKMAGHERTTHRGPARVFEREEDAMAAVTRRAIKAGDVVVIRYEGPRGGRHGGGRRVARARRARSRAGAVARLRGPLSRPVDDDRDGRGPPGAALARSRAGRRVRALGKRRPDPRGGVGPPPGAPLRRE